MPKRKLSRSYATAGSYKRRRRSVAATASAALRIASQIKRGIEVKGFGVSLSTGDLISTVQTKHLTAIPQGDGNGSRDGDHIMLTRVRLNGVITADGASGVNGLVRLVIVQNMRQQPDTDALMTSQFTSADILGFNLKNQGFHNLYVHYDKVHHIGPANETAATPVYQQATKYINIDIPMKRPVKVSFNEATGADIDRNGFYVFAVSNVNTSGPSLVYEAFVDFTDA